jgi:hypothetical protein
VQKNWTKMPKITQTKKERALTFARNLDEQKKQDSPPEPEEDYMVECKELERHVIEMKDGMQMNVFVVTKHMFFRPWQDCPFPNGAYKVSIEKWYDKKQLDALGWGRELESWECEEGDYKATLKEAIESAECEHN